MRPTRVVCCWGSWLLLTSTTRLTRAFSSVQLVHREQLLCQFWNAAKTGGKSNLWWGHWYAGGCGLGCSGRYLVAGCSWRNWQCAVCSLFLSSWVSPNDGWSSHFPYHFLFLKAHMTYSRYSKKQSKGSFEDDIFLTAILVCPVMLVFHVRHVAGDEDSYRGILGWVQSGGRALLRSFSTEY